MRCAGSRGGGAIHIAGGRGVLRGGSGPGDGQALERGHGVEPVLRRLRGDVVAYAVARIEIEIRRGLKAAAQGDQDTLGHILLSEADGRGAGAVDIDGHVGVVEGLLDARIDGAGNMAYIFEHALGKGAVVVEIGPHDLDVDWGG